MPTVPGGTDLRDGVESSCLELKPRLLLSYRVVLCNRPNEPSQLEAGALLREATTVPPAFAGSAAPKPRGLRPTTNLAARSENFAQPPVLPRASTRYRYRCALSH